MILCNIPLAKQLEINEWTHENGAHFIATETRGLFGWVLMTPPRIAILNVRDARSIFNDFGPKFTCVDPTGEQPLTGMIVSVQNVRGLS